MNRYRRDALARSPSANREATFRTDCNCASTPPKPEPLLDEQTLRALAKQVYVDREDIRLTPSQRHQLAEVVSRLDGDNLAKFLSDNEQRHDVFYAGLALGAWRRAEGRAADEAARAARAARPKPVPRTKPRLPDPIEPVETDDERAALRRYYANKR